MIRLGCTDSCFLNKKEHFDTASEWKIPWRLGTEVFKSDYQTTLISRVWILASPGDNMPVNSFSVESVYSVFNLNIFVKTLNFVKVQGGMFYHVSVAHSLLLACLGQRTLGSSRPFTVSWFERVNIRVLPFLLTETVYSACPICWCPAP
jgi:hypothetical protein